MDKTTKILEEPKPECRLTQTIFIGSKLLLSPLEALYTLLAFIFAKDLNATPFQLTLLVSLRPTLALLSFYGTLIIKEQPKRLKWFIITTHALGVLPCLLFPFVNNIWFFIFSFGIFTMASRAKIPAWSELLKLNLSAKDRSKTFSQGATLSYLGGILVPLFISPIIDRYPQSWKWIFFSLSLMQLFNLILISFLKLKKISREAPPPTYPSLSSILVTPWKNWWTLMHQMADFRKYQIVFLFGGAGLMLMQPVLPIFFKNTLNLSYTELAIAICLCKGIGYALTSSSWSKWLHRVSIHQFNFYVTFLAALFALVIISSSFQLELLYAAYLIYGVMQAGSELSWNLSGPIFSQEKDSTVFTGVNIAMVGLRGSIAPFLGELLFLYFSSTVVIGFGGTLCLIGSLYSLSLVFNKLKFRTILNNS